MSHAAISSTKQSHDTSLTRCRFTEKGLQRGSKICAAFPPFAITLTFPIALPVLALAVCDLNDVN